MALMGLTLAPSPITIAAALGAPPNPEQFLSQRRGQRGGVSAVDRRKTVSAWRLVG